MVSEGMFEASTEEHEEVRKTLLVKWFRPPLGWFKLNTDGSSILHRGLAGGGGIIRDAFGNWVIGFSSSFDFTSSIMAELSALRHGLVMAKNIGVAKIVVELDAKIAVNLITNMSKTKKSMKSIVMECKNLLQQFQEYIVQHNYREGNRVADVLAKMGSHQVDTFTIHYHYAPPNPQVNFLFAVDNMNVLTARDMKS